MSGLIVAGIVAIWVVVLVPMWLNRHDAANASRSMDTFSTAMRVLSRRQPGSGSNSGSQRYVVMPQRENWGLTVDNRPDSRPASKAQVRKAQKAFRGKAGLIERRRRLGIALVTLVMVTAVVSVLGYTPWFANGIADVLAVLFVVHLRGQARRAQQFTSRRSAQPAAMADAALGGRATRTAANRRPAAGIEASIRAGYAGYAEEQLVVSASAAGTENGSRWEPVPVPLPTYVSKPVVKRPAARASTPVPVVDLTKPGAWTDGDIDVRHLLLDETGSGTISASEGAASVSASADRSRPAITFEDEELDQILSRRRAVND